MLSQVSKDVGEVVEVGMLVVGTVLALDEEVHELVKNASVVGAEGLRSGLLAVEDGFEGVLLDEVGEEHGKEVGVGLLGVLCGVSNHT